MTARFDPVVFGNLVFNALAKAKLSLREAEAITGVDQATIHRVTHGRPPTVENYLRLCDFIKTTL